MLSVNNFFGIDLEKMPNDFCVYKRSTYNSSGKIVKDYSYSIDSNCENNFFHRVEIKVIGNEGTNFIFESIRFKIENAVDIAFVIERDLFNGGNLNYLNYYSEHSRRFHDAYFRFEWKYDKITIELSRFESELSLKVWSTYFYDKDIREKKNSIQNEGLIGGDVYPQGCELKNHIPKRDLKGAMEESMPDFEGRYIQLRIEATNDALLFTETLLERILAKEEVVFMGLFLDNAPVLFEPDTKCVLPLVLERDRMSVRSGSQLLAVVEEIGTDNLDRFIDFTLFVQTGQDKKNACYMSSEQLLGRIPKYVEDIVELYAEDKIGDKNINLSTGSEKKFENKEIEVIIPSHNENLFFLKKLLHGKMEQKEYMFLGKLLGNESVFTCDELDGFILPISDNEIKEYLLKGKSIIGSVKEFNTDHLDTYIGFTMLVVYPKE